MKLFQASPARRADFLQANGIDDDESLNSFKFPEAFCGHRWLANGPALSPAVEILQSLKKHVLFVNHQPKSKRVSTGSFRKLEEEVKTEETLNLCFAKLEFS